jgi:hypothetical protein
MSRKTEIFNRAYCIYLHFTRIDFSLKTYKNNTSLVFFSGAYRCKSALNVAPGVKHFVKCPFNFSYD